MKQNFGKTGFPQDGFTFVELMVAMLISLIVFSCWIRICNIQGVRKESLRREAVERAAGILDMCDKDKFSDYDEFSGTYKVSAPFKFEAPLKQLENDDDKNTIWPLFQDAARNPIGYRLVVASLGDGSGNGWDDGTWAFLDLYNIHSVRKNMAGKPFCSFRMLVRRTPL